MPRTFRALAEDHASLIGAAASVVVMSLSFACALARIDVSLPVYPERIASAASSGETIGAAGAPTAPASQPGAPNPTKEASPVGCGAMNRPGTARPESPNGCAIDPGRTRSEAHVGATRDVAPAPLPAGGLKGTQPSLSAARHISLAAATPPVLPAPRRVSLRRPARRVVPAERVAAETPVQPRPTPVAPLRAAPSREPAVAGLITPSMLRRLSAALKLTPEQRALYLPVERQLLAIGAQQRALVSAGQDPKDAFGIGTAMSMYGVAQPFLNALSEDQKARVRAEARNMGFGFAAAQI